MATAWTVKRPKPISEMPKGLRVLVVEDDADCAASMALLLRMHARDVRAAADSSAALDEAQAHPPDVVLLDIGLPGINGDEFAKRLQEQEAEKKPLLIAVTGFGSETDRRRSGEVGIDLLLVKPTDMGYLIRLLQRFERFID